MKVSKISSRASGATFHKAATAVRSRDNSSNAAVLMQRVQLMTSRIAPLEVELREGRDESQKLQRELDETKLSAARFEAQVAAGLEKSFSFRLGRAILSPALATRGAVRTVTAGSPVLGARAIYLGRQIFQ